AVSGCGFRSGLDPAPMLGERHAELFVGEPDATRPLPTRPQFAGSRFGQPGEHDPVEERQDHIIVVPNLRDDTAIRPARSFDTKLIAHPLASYDAVLPNASQTTFSSPLRSTRWAASRTACAQAVSTCRCWTGYFEWV